MDEILRGSLAPCSHSLLANYIGIGLPDLFFINHGEFHSYVVCINKIIITKGLQALSQFHTSATVMAHSHVLLLSFPCQGHINPSLQLAKRLIHLGVRVTFATTISAIHGMGITSPPECLTYMAAYSDGYDYGLEPGYNMDHYIQ
ncbi:hypothetical protein CRYUN_Cryun36dG0028400 [Craigia yunnanensis]